MPLFHRTRDVVGCIQCMGAAPSSADNGKLARGKAPSLLPQGRRCLTFISGCAGRALRVE